MSKITNVGSANFKEEVLVAEELVIVDFWAEWCGPCKMVARELDLLADRHPEIKVVKLNIDDSPDLANRYSVMSIPTIALFRDGELVMRSIGAKSADLLAQDLALTAV